MPHFLGSVCHIFCRNPLILTDFCAIRTPIVWHILGAYFFANIGGGGGQNYFDPSPRRFDLQPQTALQLRTWWGPLPLQLRGCRLSGTRCSLIWGEGYGPKRTDGALNVDAAETAALCGVLPRLLLEREDQESPRQTKPKKGPKLRQEKGT